MKRVTVGDRIAELEAELLELQAMKFNPEITDNTVLVESVCEEFDHIYRLASFPRKRYYTAAYLYHNRGTAAYFKYDRSSLGNEITTQSRTVIVR